MLFRGVRVHGGTQQLENEILRATAISTSSTDLRFGRSVYYSTDHSLSDRAFL